MERPRLLIILLVVVMFVGAAPAYLSQIADYGAAQLARQAVDIRAPYLARMAQITYLQNALRFMSGRRRPKGRRPMTWPSPLAIVSR
jgi:hypothetical protein